MDDVLISWLTEPPKAIQLFEKEGFAPFRNSGEVTIHIWKPATVFDHEKPVFRGIAIGINGYGYFLIENNKSIVEVINGELFLRLNPKHE